MPDEKKLVKEEIVKINSNYLRGTIKEELTKNSSHFEESDNKLLKFHGIYQQDDRDKRSELISSGKERAYSFMIRTKLPGGELTALQYLSLNEICEKYTNKTLRITTRQTLQFHGILKGNLKALVKEINDQLINSYGACGDVVRNIMAPPVSDIDPEYEIDLIKVAKELSNHLEPNTRAYYEIWVDEEKIDLKGKDEEPIYGKTYLPRKFKIGISYPWDNSIDLFTQDIGIVAIKNGFNILIGGGLGHTHNKPETYPRLASELCFVKAEDLIKTVEAIVLVQRDFGCRENRKHARMKYLVDDKGLDWFKSEIEKRVGNSRDYSLLLPFKPIKEYKTRDYLGWHKQKNGNWYLGLFIENGRILDDEKKKIKSGLKEIVEKFKCNIRLTPQQNIILTNIKEEDKSKIDEIVQKSNIFTENSVSPLRRNSIACVSLPTCSLALAEAERYLPKVITELEKLGYAEEAFSIRMSGCPNSCSRPPVAELGIIGTSANKYNIYIGGDFDGKRLNRVYLENISSNLLVSEIEKIIKTYRTNRNPNERFGDFCNRVGIEGLH